MENKNNSLELLLNHANNLKAVIMEQSKRDGEIEQICAILSTEEQGEQRALLFQKLKKRIRELFKDEKDIKADTVITYILDYYEHHGYELGGLRPLAKRTKKVDTSAACYDDTGKLTIHNLNAFLQSKGIEARYNAITHKSEYFGYDKAESADHINENIIAMLFDEMQHDFKRCTTTTIKQFLNVITTRNIYNPVLKALEGIEWDGTDRLSAVYSMFDIDETDELSRTLMKKWFMQCICGLHNSMDNPFSLDIVLIFKGAQGIGKTRFFEHLTTDKRLFGEGVVIDTRNKDSIINSTSKWISELGEIGTTMKRDIDALKAFLTSSTDTYRMPYGQTVLEYPRLTSFCGTTNDEQFLIDETGNRRFATIPLSENVFIDYDTQVKNFDSLQFWKQIENEVEKAILSDNKTYSSVFRLTRDELTALNERNREFEKPLKGEEEVRDVISKYQGDCVAYHHIDWRLMTIGEFISNNPELRGLSNNQVGKVLSKLGFTETRNKNGRFRMLPEGHYSKDNYSAAPIQKTK